MYKKIIILIGLFLLPVLAFSGDIGTFREFYAPDNGQWGWLEWLAIIGAVVFAVAATFYSGGTAAPVGASAVGSALGLTGATALAVGAAIVAGSTELTFCFAVDKLVAHFNYSNFKEDSKSMSTLPLVNNSAGGGECKRIFQKLSEINTNELYFSSGNLEVLNDALYILEKSKSTGKSKYKEDLIKMVILFQQQKYDSAGALAQNLISQSLVNRYSASMAYYVYAVSLFYEKHPNIDESIAALSKSIELEPDNPILMLIYGIYMDRFIYLLNWREIPSSAYYEVAKTASLIKGDKNKSMALYVLYARCVGLIEKCRKEISIVAKDSTINEPQTERVLWNKFFLKTRLANIADYIYQEFSKLSAEDEIADGFQQYYYKLYSLRDSESFLTMLSYSFKRHVLEIILPPLMGLLCFIYILRKRRVLR